MNFNFDYLHLLNILTVVNLARKLKNIYTNIVFDNIYVPIWKLWFLNNVKIIIVLKNVDDKNVKRHSRDIFYCLNSFVYTTNSDVLIKINDFIQMYINRTR